MTTGNLAACLDPSLRDPEGCCELLAWVETPRETDPARVEARKSRREMVMVFFLARNSGERISYITGQEKIAKPHGSRRGLQLVLVAVGAETEQGGNVAHAVQGLVLRNQNQADVALDRRRDQGFTNIIQVSRGAPTNRAIRDQVRVEVAAVRALDGAGRVLLRHDDGFHFALFGRAQYPSQPGHAASIALGLA